MSNSIFLNLLEHSDPKYEYFLTEFRHVLEVFLKIMNYQLFKKNKDFLTWLDMYEEKYSSNEYSLVEKFFGFKKIVDVVYEMAFYPKVSATIQDDVEELDILMYSSLSLLENITPKYKFIQASKNIN